MDRNYGHFGAPAWYAAIAVGVALLAHLAVPFGVIEYDGPAPLDNDLITGFEASNIYDDLPDALTALRWSLGLVWIGIAVAALGGAMLLVLGYQPLKVDAARWIGCLGGLLTVVGATMSLMPSMYHTGTGFSTFLGMLLFTEFRVQFWAISPVIVAVASLVAIHHGLRVMVRVSANRDGIRDAAERHAGAARAGAGLMATVLMVPWSIGMLPDGLNDGRSMRVDGGSTAPFFFSAQDIQGATLAEVAMGGHLRYAGDSWQMLGLGINVLVALAWVAIVVGALGALVGTARSVGLPSILEAMVRFLLVPTALLWVAAAILYLLAWFYFKPVPDPGARFLPGFLPIVVLIPGALLLWRHARIAGLPAAQRGEAASTT